MDFFLPPILLTACSFCILSRAFWILTHGQRHFYSLLFSFIWSVLRYPWLLFPHQSSTTEVAEILLVMPKKYKYSLTVNIVCNFNVPVWRPPGELCCTVLCSPSSFLPPALSLLSKLYCKKNRMKFYFAFDILI